MTQPLGIIAGKGDLPGLIAQSRLAAGESVFVVRIKGLAEPGLSSVPGADFNLGQFGAAFEALKAAGCERLTFAGYVVRPDFASIEFDAVGQALLPRIIKAATGGDSDSLSLFAAVFEEEGFEVLGVKEACPELLCPNGVITQAEPDEAAMNDLNKAWHIVELVGREDIGQASVVSAGIVVAVEAQEGTDAMLTRAADIDVVYQGDRPDRMGVLVKRPKPRQDLRMDLPVIGPKTVDLAARAGLAGIGLEAQTTIIIDREETLRRANEAGLFIIGLSDGAMSVAP